MNDPFDYATVNVGEFPAEARCNGTAFIGLPFPVTLFPDITGRTLQVKQLTVDAIAELIRSTHGATKADLPLLKLASFGDQKTREGSLRNDANALSVFGVEVDYDDEKIPFDAAMTRLREAQVEAIAYTSPSHTPETPRWRVLFPLSEQIKPSERKALVDRAQAILRFAKLDPRSWTLSQAFYYGVSAAAPEFRCETTRGLRLDMVDGYDLEPVDDEVIGKGFDFWRSAIGDHEGGAGFRKPIHNAIACFIGKHGASCNTDWLRRELERVIRKAQQIPRPKFTKDDHVASLDKLIEWTIERERQKPQKRKQAQGLASIAEGVGVFHTPDGTGFVDVEVNGHRETWAVKSKHFKRWLAHRFYKDSGDPAKRDALDQAVELTEARARFDAVEREVFLRVARVGDAIYLDLADDNWRVVKIDGDGWRVVDDPPVRFRRTDGMLPLPLPVGGGSLDELRAFVNLDDEDFKFGVAWMLAAAGGVGPYPILVITGEHGAAKTSTGNRLQGVIDPHVPMSRKLPRDDRDLYIAAHNAHCLHFENISSLPAWVSDTLCSLATGGGFATRTLYDDNNETIFRGMRPIVMDGIVDLVERPDLADRALNLTLGEITEEERRTEEDINTAWESAHPRVLGALLDVLSHGLTRLATTKLDKLPRMADFARWIAACETAMWDADTFGTLYEENRKESLNDTTEADPFVDEIRKFLIKQPWRDYGSDGLPFGADHWVGTATDLLIALEGGIAFEVKHTREWPKGARAVSAALKRNAAGLRQLGITVTHDRTDNQRTIKLAQTKKVE